MSFTNAPVTRTLVLGLVSSSVAASLFDVKHYFYIDVATHFWTYHQTWRAFIFQLCYTNSAEVLSAVITLYNLRVVERLWGSRKYATFLVVSHLLTSILTPTLLTFFLRPFTAGFFNYLPAGPTPIIFAVLAQYHAIVPHMYKLRMALTNQPPSSAGDAQGLIFSDKSLRYGLALQLALFQWPGSLLGAAVGWIVGHAWREDMLPGALTRWRVPGWVVGMRSTRREQEFEGLRRRLEGEGEGEARTTGVDEEGEGEAARRRPLGTVLDQVSGAI